MNLSHLLTMVRLDAKLAWEHKLVHVTLAVALIFGALLGFAVPEQLDYGGPDSISNLSAAQDLGPAPTQLEPGAVKPPFNELMLLVIFTLDLCILGFMFGSVMLLQDKEHGTIRLFRVGPGTGAVYIGSKLVVNLGLSLVNFVILTALVAPWALGQPALYGLTLLICMGMTLLGMTIAVYTRNISQWFFPMLVVSMVATLPTSLMFSPTRALAWTFWLPTYHMLFGAEAILFARHGGVATTALVYALGFAALMSVACAVAVRARLMKETR